jgi:hypothetical protein
MLVPTHTVSAFDVYELLRPLVIATVATIVLLFFSFTKVIHLDGIRVALGKRLACINEAITLIQNLLIVFALPLIHLHIEVLDMVLHLGRLFGM